MPRNVIRRPNTKAVGTSDGIFNFSGIAINDALRLPGREILTVDNSSRRLLTSG